MKKGILFIVMMLFGFTLHAQHPSTKTPQPIHHPAEIVYEPGLNIDSLDKASPIPRLLFIPEQYRTEYIQLWGDKNYYNITIAILPDHLTEKMQEQIEGKRREME